jgi:hypothetical protein
MGKLLDLIRGPVAQRAPSRRTVTGVLVDIEIVGESYYEAHIRAVAGRASGGEFEIVLQAEPDNPYDGNAVGVYAYGGKVGHLSREMAAAWQPMILVAQSEGFVVAGYAAVFGGTPDKPNLGVFGAAPWPKGAGRRPLDRWGR